MRRHPFAAAALCAALAGCGAADRPDPEPPSTAPEVGTARSFGLERVADGFNRPTWVGAVPGDDALWVAEQPGRIVRLTRRGPKTVLDLRGEIRTGSEQGLLGVAAHPDFATEPRLYVHWSDRSGDTRVAEFAADGRGRFDTQRRRPLLHVEQPEENHNGGQIAFAPDGRLYLGLGDGGGAFDPRGSAQDPGRLLGKILAADVEAAAPRWEIVLSGLRNPWRFSFDAALGEVWIGDVGQDELEEINRILLEFDEPPKNLGWSAFEGTRRLPGDRHLDRTGELIWPVAQYSHDDGCSVTGGVVYRGTALPRLNGRYVYGDFCSGVLWSLRGTPDGGAEDLRREHATVPQLTHIGTDNDGELVLASAAGAIHRAVNR
ncbi:MAG: PQQ-dependent sugar dehydrogenase [Solirubrobacterales bacterium]